MNRTPRPSPLQPAGDPHRPRRAAGIWAVAGIAAGVAGVLLSPDALKAALDRIAADGRSDFFTLEMLAGLRLALVLAGPCLVAWPFLVGRRSAGPSVDRPADASGWRLRVAFLAAAVLLAAGVTGRGLARIAVDPPLTKDTKFYLGESLDAAGHGGPTALVRRCFAGSYREDNRHPFYPGLLSLVAERSERFTDRARLFSLAGAIVALLLFMVTCRRAGGEAAGALGGILLATNGAFLEQSVTVACESWWMVFAVIWFDRLAVVATRDRPGIGAWAAAGVAAGLAFLTKGTGTLLLVATVAYAVSRLRWSVTPRLVAFLVAFALVALPLLWRNTVVFSNPFWNVNSGRVMWLDRWEDFHDPRVMAAAGPVRYVTDHTWGEMAVRMGTGLVKQAIHLLEVLSPIRPAVGWGVPIALLVLLGLVRRPPRLRRALLLMVFLLFVVAFAWYAKVVSDERFLAAIVPLLLLPAAGSVASFGKRGRAVLVGAAMAAGAAWMVAVVPAGALSFRLDRYRPRPEAEVVHRFLREHVGHRDGVHYLLGPSDTLSFDWDRTIRGTRHPFPRSPRRLARYLESRVGRRIRYAIVEAPDRWGDQPAAEAWCRLASHGGIEAHTPPSGWRVARRIPPDRPAVLIFERDPRASH